MGISGNNMSLAIVNPDVYEHQLTEKSRVIQADFQSFNIPELEVFPSAPANYRMRAEFRVWHDKDTSHYRMFDPETKEPFNVTAFPAGSVRMVELMPLVMAEITHNPLLRQRLFQIEFLTTQTDEALVTLIYHKPLSELWQVEAKKLQYKLGISVVGRARKQKVVLEKDFVTEQLTVSGQRYVYQQVENSFTQPNAGVNEKMLGWASECCQENKGDLLELYCGNGNFTCVLAQHFDNVLATEISKVSVASAQYNFQANDINNVAVVRLSSEELTQAINGERLFRRLQAIDLTRYKISTVFVDPPRAGLDKKTEQLVQQFDNIVYVSCNPETLKSNLRGISETHRIERIALFDQFPYTNHAEMGVYLVR